MDEKKSKPGRGGVRPGAGRPAEKPVAIEGKLMRPVDVVKALALSDEVAPSTRLRAAEMWRHALAAQEPEPLEIFADNEWHQTVAGFEASPEQWAAWRALKAARDAWLRVNRPAR